MMDKSSWSIIKSRNAPSTKSAHSASDISFMKTAHQRQQSPDYPTTPLNGAVRLIPSGSVSFSSINEPTSPHLQSRRETSSIQQGFVHLHPEDADEFRWMPIGK
ncbi:hypothetical protein Q8A67_022552 [Cirrhinus molitorella]|uniref:Uncharacterized protein n=1 Tax=Cirrhinus molitorella TaxID=172907 RepID=A0AA88P5E6_9TELE|nr:hypothetical protein Q8A67_022552 [Cirrhinus molitorella]